METKVTGFNKFNINVISNAKVKRDVSRENNRYYSQNVQKVEVEYVNMWLFGTQLT